MVPEEGIEPTLPFEKRILSPSRLPVPPLRPYHDVRASEPYSPGVRVAPRCVRCLLANLRRKLQALLTRPC